jgi:hypothetical protein
LDLYFLLACLVLLEKLPALRRIKKGCGRVDGMTVIYQIIILFQYVPGIINRLFQARI